MFRLATLSLGNRALIALITVFAAVFGVITMGSLKQELIPSIEFPQITVITSMPGASPEVVDKQLSRPLETALNSVEGLESTTSTSRNGVSQITMVFTYGSNLDRARNQIDRAISNAKRVLPADVEPQSVAGRHVDAAPSPSWCEGSVEVTVPADAGNWRQGAHQQGTRDRPSHLVEVDVPHRRGIPVAADDRRLLRAAESCGVVLDPHAVRIQLCDRDRRDVERSSSRAPCDVLGARRGRAKRK